MKGHGEGFVRRLTIRLRALVRRDTADREIAEELQYHLDRETERLVASGMPRRDAECAARRAFGNPTTHAEDAGETMRWLWLEQLGQDLRYAARSLRKTPVFTAVAVFSLALGVGANVAVLSATSALLLRRLPVRAPEQLVSTVGGAPYGMFREFRALRGAFVDAAAIAVVDRSTVRASTAVDGVTRVALVSGNYFGLLGVTAAAGRVISPDDDRNVDAHPVVVVSDRFWRGRLGGATDVIGRTIQVNTTKFTIIGVAPAPFEGETIGRPIDLWIPLMMQSEVMPEWPGLVTAHNGFLRIVFRLRPGVTAAEAQAAIQPAYQRFEIGLAGANATAEFRRSLVTDPLILLPIAHGFAGNRDDTAQWLRTVALIVALVLLIACTNIATLFLVRGAARAREMAVRLAIGASRGRVVRQVITEAIVLSVAGGAAGALLAATAAALLATNVSVGPVQLDARAPSTLQSFDLRPGAGIYFVAALMSVLAGVAFGIVPALRAARQRHDQALVGQRTATSGGIALRRGFGAVLVATQVALSIVLLVATGLLIRSLHNLRTRELGVDRSHLALAWVVPAQTGRKAGEYPAYVARMMERLRGVPGVANVNVSNHGLLEGGDEGGESSLLTIDGAPARAGLPVLRDAVGPNFFATAGMRIVAGRDLTESDDSSRARVAVINETMARHLFAGASPVGKRLGAPKDPLEIVGVVSDARHGSPRDKRGVWYVSYKQFPALLRSLCIVVRANGDPARLRPAISKALQEFDPQLPVLRVDTVEEQLADVLFRERLIADVASVFGLLAALLACIGLYGVIAYAIARRTNEIGVRVALGATRAVIVRSVLSDSISLATGGILIGVALSLAGSRLIASRLYGVAPNDPLTILESALTMLGVALLAAWLPAARAASVDPVKALRAD